MKSLHVAEEGIVSNPPAEVNPLPEVMYTLS